MAGRGHGYTPEPIEDFASPGAGRKTASRTANLSALDGLEKFALSGAAAAAARPAAASSKWINPRDHAANAATKFGKVPARTASASPKRAAPTRGGATRRPARTKDDESDDEDDDDDDDDDDYRGPRTRRGGSGGGGRRRGFIADDDEEEEQDWGSENDLDSEEEEEEAADSGDDDDDDDDEGESDDDDEEDGGGGTSKKRRGAAKPKKNKKKLQQASKVGAVKKPVKAAASGGRRLIRGAPLIESDDDDDGGEDVGSVFSGSDSDDSDEDGRGRRRNGSDDDDDDDSSDGGRGRGGKGRKRAGAVKMVAERSLARTAAQAPVAAAARTAAAGHDDDDEDDAAVVTSRRPRLPLAPTAPISGDLDDSLVIVGDASAADDESRVDGEDGVDDEETSRSAELLGMTKGNARKLTTLLKRAETARTSIVEALTRAAVSASSSGSTSSSSAAGSAAGTSAGSAAQGSNDATIVIDAPTLQRRLGIFVEGVNVPAAGAASAPPAAASSSAGAGSTTQETSGAVEVAATARGATSAPQLALAPHQLMGVAWMHLLYKTGLNGVLADEMGLGKTVQVAVLLSLLHSAYGDSGPHLIITPASTLGNWERELRKWAPKLRVGVYRGGARRAEDQQALMRRDPRYAPGGRGDADDEDDDGDLGSGAAAGGRAAAAMHAAGSGANGSDTDGLSGAKRPRAGRDSDGDDASVSVASSGGDRKRRKMLDGSALVVDDDDADATSAGSADDGRKAADSDAEEADEEEEEQEDEDSDDDDDDDAFDGGRRRGSGQQLQQAPLAARSTRSFDVLLTTYTLFDRSGSTGLGDRKFLMKRLAPWSYVVLDEGHAVKNSEAARSQHIAALSTKARHRLLLSGTPFQNDLSELASLLRFVAGDNVIDRRARIALEGVEEGMLQATTKANKQRAQAAKAAAKAQAAAAKRKGKAAAAAPAPAALDVSVEDAEAEEAKARERRNAVVSLLARLCEPFILRRRKDDVLSQLPPKTTVTRRVSMTPRQTAIYTAVTAKIRAAVLPAGGGDGSDVVSPVGTSATAAADADSSSSSGARYPARARKPATDAPGSAAESTGSTQARAASGAAGGPLNRFFGAPKTAPLQSHAGDVLVIDSDVDDSGPVGGKQADAPVVVCSDDEAPVVVGASRTERSAAAQPVMSPQERPPPLVMLNEEELPGAPSASSSSGRGSKAAGAAATPAGARASSNMFTTMRKATQHPLLMRTSWYSNEATLVAIARAALACGAFVAAEGASFADAGSGAGRKSASSSGPASSSVASSPRLTLAEQRAVDELRVMSDFAIHTMCAQHGRAPPEPRAVSVSSDSDSDDDDDVSAVRAARAAIARSTRSAPKKCACSFVCDGYAHAASAAALASTGRHRTLMSESVLAADESTASGCGGGSSAAAAADASVSFDDADTAAVDGAQSSSSCATSSSATSAPRAAAGAASIPVVAEPDHPVPLEGTELAAGDPATVMAPPSAATLAQGPRAVLHACRLPIAALLDSCKVQYLCAALPALAAGSHRILLFSQWTTILDILEELLLHMGVMYLRLDGSTPVASRQPLMDAFSAPDSPYRVFLLSTRAGGLGLNLTAADTVILHDSDLNPQVDAQAVDRAHRIGQKRPVTVVRLVASSSVDELIERIAERKATLEAALNAAASANAGGAGAFSSGIVASRATGDGDAEGDESSSSTRAAGSGSIGSLLMEALQQHAGPRASPR